MNIKNEDLMRNMIQKLEARVGIEPTIEDLQSSALPLGDRALRLNAAANEASQ